MGVSGFYNNNRVRRGNRVKNGNGTNLSYRTVKERF